MIQKSIYFKHVTEDWRCPLDSKRILQKNIDFVYSASSLSSGPKVLEFF